MEQKLFKMPSIEQFRTVIKNVAHKTRYIGKDDNGDAVFDESIALPTLNFKGTIKLHGTNAAIIYLWNPLEFDYSFYAQSKENIITPQKDNAGFATFVHTSDTEKLLSLVMKVFNEDYTPESVRIYGEWCGGSIQKGVSLNALPKMFVIFGVKIDDIWLTDDKLQTIKLPDAKIYNILDYPTYSVKIDFNNPASVTDKLAELTDIVEKNCPVGQAFGVDGTGEGIVWRCVDEGWRRSDYWFKTKGEKHKASSTRDKIPVDVERVNSMQELVSNFLTESRLNQGVEMLKIQGLQLEKKNVGSFLKWIYNDIIKEELDTIVENGFEPKEISGAISNQAREWYFEQENKMIGL